MMGEKKPPLTLLKIVMVDELQIAVLSPEILIEGGKKHCAYLFISELVFQFMNSDICTRPFIL
jgi:hypothetical protein